MQENAQKLLVLIKAQPDIQYDPQTAGQVLQDLAEYGTILSLLYEELYQNLEVIELRYEAARMQVRQIETYVKLKKAALATAMQQANDTELEPLLESAKKLDVLLKSSKETSK